MNDTTLSISNEPVHSIKLNFHNGLLSLRNVHNTITRRGKSSQSVKVKIWVVGYARVEARSERSTA